MTNETKAHWERIYGTKSPLEVSWYQAEPTTSLDLISRTGIAFDGAVIDVGGGASVLVDRLYERGFRNLAVLDIAASALAVAKQRLGDRAKHVEWFEADVRTFAAPHPFNLWHDRAVFHFLTQKWDRVRYAEVLRNSLRAGGHAILATFASDGPTKCSGLDVVRYDAEAICTELGGGFTFVEQQFETHVTPSGAEQKFTYFRFIKNG